MSLLPHSPLTQGETMTNQKPLRSELLKRSARINLAATQAFHSLKTSEPDNQAVFRLQRALIRIEKHSDELPARLLPRPLGPSGPPGAQWGPFLISSKGQDFDNE